VMLKLNARVFLLSVVVLPVSLLALHYYQARLSAQVKAVRERSADIGSFLLETLLGVRVVITANAEAREIARFKNHNQSFLDALLKMQLTSFLSGAVPGTVITLCTSALFLYGGKLVIDGRLTTGSLVALMAYHARLLAPIQNLMGLYTNLVSGGVALQRVWELFDTKVTVLEKPGAKALTAVQGDLVCENVSFRHGEKVVFENLSFRVPAGTICAVVGPSGAGKSTLADLLVRFYDPAGGALRLDGEDLRDLRLSDLRQAVTLLDQMPYLFNATVRENIAYGRPGATDEEIMEAARMAEIHNRIEALPGGYGTVLAERGQTLSTGERQRVALARALLANPRVLILDEPTSALDEANETAIAQTLVSALRGRTAVVITHRPSLARIADQTLVLG
jgi:ATP-binding cassette, subfamily B, bacterial